MGRGRTFFERRNRLKGDAKVVWIEEFGGIVDELDVLLNSSNSLVCVSDSDGGRSTQIRSSHSFH